MDKSIYLCFGEYGIEGSVSYVIRSINLMRLFITQDRDFSLAKCTTISGELSQLAEYSGRYMAVEMGCGVLGSKIILGGGVIGGFQAKSRRVEPFPCRQLFQFETNPASPQGGSFVALKPEFVQGKAQPLLVFVNGKLYALGIPLFYFINPYCEVFDEATEKWCPLPDPPVLHKPDYAASPPESVSWAVAGTNILVSGHLSSSRYDTTNPSQGWRPLYKFPNERDDEGPFKTSPFFASRGFHFHGKTLVVDDGQQFVLFAYRGNCSEGISVYLMSYDFECIRAVHPRLQLPKLPSEFLHSASITYSFLHVEGKTVCLFLSRLVSETKKILVFPYVFDFIIGEASRGRLFLGTTVRPTHMLECDTKQLVESDANVEMLGAFYV